MDYKLILDEIKPTEDEKNRVREVSGKLLEFINDKCDPQILDEETNQVKAVDKEILNKN